MLAMSLQAQRVVWITWSGEKQRILAGTEDEQVSDLVAQALSRQRLGR